MDSEIGPVPQSLTEAYQKARKQYALFSGLLVAWELVGIELTKAPLANFNITLKSPQAAPYVLIALVLYFAFRITIEWLQCDRSRRTLRVSLIDFTVSHVLAVAALALYVAQRLLDLQLVDIPSDGTDFVITLGIMAGASVAMVITVWFKDRNKVLTIGWGGAATMLVALLLFSWWWSRTPYDHISAALFLVALVVVSSINWVMVPYLYRKVLRGDND